MKQESIYSETLSNGFSFQMRFIPGGAFDMGSTNDDKDARDSEKPQRLGVKVFPFYLAPYTVTGALWKAVMGEKNNIFVAFREAQSPAFMANWHDTQEFITALNHQTDENRKILGLGAYRLPTEAEWEYAARGGPRSGGYRYAGSDKLKEVGWYEDNSDNETQVVGLLLPNELGLYDMSGNVWEWVEDNWHSDYIGAPNDSRPWLSDDKSARRVLRGGSSFHEQQYCRSAFRNYFASGNRNYDFGFRLALSPSLEQSTLPIL